MNTIDSKQEKCTGKNIGNLNISLHKHWHLVDGNEHIKMSDQPKLPKTIISPAQLKLVNFEYLSLVINPQCCVGGN